MAGLAAMIRSQELDSTRLDLSLELARMLTESGRTGDVRRLFEQSGLLSIVRPEPWALLGEACATERDPRCAARAFRQVRRLAGGDWTSWVAEGHRQEAERLTGRPDEPGEEARRVALEAKRRLAAEPRRALDLLSPWPEYPGLLLLHAEAAARAGEPEVVRRSMTLFSDLALDDGGGLAWPGPEAGPEASLEAAASLSRIGGFFFSQRLWPDAVQAYAIGAKLVPDDPGFQFNTGLAFERSGDVDAALGRFETTLSMAPEFPKARKHRDALRPLVEGS